MRICIYCGKDSSETTFKSSEHVIPKLLGTFENNPTLVNHVCDHCNSDVFGPLETRFKEDTEEGVFCQMVNFAESYQIRLGNKKIRTAIELGLKEPFFNEAFPFLTFKNGKQQITFISQIKIKGFKGDRSLVLLIDPIKKLPRDSGKFRKLQKLLKGVQSKDVSIFVHTGDDPEKRDVKETIKLLHDLGIDYKPGPEKSIPFDEPTDPVRRAEVSMDVTIDHDTARVLAKIAFNYLAYCAIKSGEKDILMHPNFQKIKSYILGELKLPLTEVIIEKPTYAAIISEENEKKVRYVGHIVTFSNERGNLIAEESFMGRLVYKILLGPLPDELKKGDFGSGHIFNPVLKKILGLTQNKAKQGTNQELRFNLFNN